MSRYLHRESNETNFFLTTKELIKRCKKNEYNAQLEVYNSLKNVLYNASYRIIRRQDEAEDIVQETFIHGFKKINQLSDDGNIGAWFRRIAVNKSLDILRKKSNVVFLDDEREIKVLEEDSLEEELDISVEFIKKCINSLKDKYRIILTLYMIEGYNHREISEMLSLKESTVRNQYKRGKDKLLSLLKSR